MDDHGPFFVFDAHCDTAQRLAGDSPVDLGERLSGGHVDLPRMAEGGVGAQVFACWVDPDINSKRWMSGTLGMISAVRQMAESHRDRIALALSGTEVASIRSSGLAAALIGIEGGHVLGEGGDALIELYEAGVRCVTLTWMNTNDLADSGDGERIWGGLSLAGRKTVADMNRLGIMIDLSHASDDTFYQTLELSASPVLVSHSSARAICDIPRNISDEMLRALAENGGVACVNFFPAFLDKACHTRVFEVWGEYRRERSRLAQMYGGDPKRADEEIGPRYLDRIGEIPMPGIEAVADHVEHIASVAGVGHTGIGSDFDGIMAVPPGLEDVSKMQSLAAVLAARGWKSADISAVMGKNLLSLFTRVCG